MIVTRIVTSNHLNSSKYQQLAIQAQRLGKIRSEVWQRFGSIKGVSIPSDRKIRDQWLQEPRQFKVSANAWKETLRDSFGNIKANRESTKEQVRTTLYKTVVDDQERLASYKKLSSDQWISDNYLRRVMRKHWKHGRNHTNNQIVVRSDNYTTFQLGGCVWLKIPGLQKGKRIAIPLNTRVEPNGTLRLILHEGIIEVHYTIEAKETENCGNETIGYR
jgi:hypothetical protein